MMPWNQLSPALAAVLVKLSGLDAAAVQARDEGASTSATTEGAPGGGPADSPGWSFPADNAGATLEYAVFSITPNGKAEIREDYDAHAQIPGDDYEPDPTHPDARLGGIIQSANQNVEVIIELSSTMQGVATPAWEVLSTVVSKLKFDSTRALFSAMGLPIWKTGPVNEIGGWINGRRVSKYVVELWCNGMTNATDDPITTIEVVPVVTSGIRSH